MKTWQHAGGTGRGTGPSAQSGKGFYGVRRTQLHCKRREGGRWLQTLSTLLPKPGKGEFHAEGIVAPDGKCGRVEPGPQ